MRTRWWAGVAAGVVLGLGVVVTAEVATDDASAQGGFAVTAEQLRSNQRISIAAVRRSNQSLDLLDPILRQPKIPNKVLGWRSQDLRDGAVTGAKIANGTVSETDLTAALAGRLPAWIVVNANGSVARRSDDRIAPSRSAAGTYRVDFKRDLGNCAWTGTQVETTDPGVVGIELAVDTQQLSVTTNDEAGAPTDRPFSLQVTC